MLSVTLMRRNSRQPPDPFFVGIILHAAYIILHPNIRLFTSFLKAMQTSVTSAPHLLMIAGISVM